ncbi:MAG TPA: toxin TcdB middle/N-terminal domain-containing protein, partial [Labilithrix sp.]|nr:toxin TcdB middle/N-terminal domain-containing protein [Labilithrix sp.]
MPVWASGWQYFRARVEGAFLRYFWSPDRKTWRVQSKAGISMELGVPLDGSSDTGALEADPSDASRIYAWHVVRTYDTMGDANSSGSPQPLNIVQYKYATIDGTTYLTDIFDTPPAANAATAPVSSYAHHTHLRYEARPDVTTSYRRGWRADVTLRLEGVDVTSYDFQATSGRQLVRRYHLSYEPNSHVSLLKSVQMEGRCPATPVPESEATGLLPPTSCPRLPAMTFGYQHVSPFRIDGSPANAELSGYEGFDERIHTLASSPPHSIDEALTDLADIDSDGLPDVVVTDPARYNHGHGVFFNKGTAFAPAVTMAVEGVLGADANVIKFTNPNLSSHDVDGDGTVNFLHMPLVKTYSVYAPRKREDGTWAWQGRQVTTASLQSAAIDFAGRNENIRLMDVNADGLVDVVYTAATEVHTFLSLGRYPGGDGQYGSATWTGPTSANISNEALRSCVPWSALPIRFSDPDVRVADMNGDGFPDIVRARYGDVRYWPGRGNGFWGTGDPNACPAGSFGQDQHIAMTNSPQFGMFEDVPSLLEDVNGDGLADFVKVRFNAIDIYLNVDGVGWTDRHVIENAPSNSSLTNRVRLTDVNGSGTPDLLWGDGYSYKYIDLAGGARPWVLTSVNNGLGGTTELEYASTTEQMLAAEAAGQPWETKAPTVAHVLARVTERDNLERVGRPAGVYVKEYTYRDPVYEGRQREFRGFKSVRVKVLGDTNHPTSIAESRFLLGECVDEPNDAGRCDVAERWRDNRREALKGLPVLAETFDESGTYLSTDHTTYRLRQLYVGLDGRAVRHVFASSSDSYRYDTGPFTPAASSVSLTDVQLERTPGVIENEQTAVSLRSTAGRAHIRKSVEVDRFGNTVNTTDYGCVAGCVAADEVTVVHTTPTRIAEGSGWLWRTTEQWVQGASSPTLLKHTERSFDAYGLVTSEEMHLTGTLPLDRFHEDPGKSVAPTLANAVTDGTYETRTFGHDAFGNPTSMTTPTGHCTEATFDTAFAQLPVSETVHTGYVPPGTS